MLLQLFFVFFSLMTQTYKESYAIATKKKYFYCMKPQKYFFD